MNNLKCKKMDRLMMNYFMKKGCKAVAEKFSLEAGFQAPVELQKLDERIEIRETIKAGKIQEAIALVNQLHPDILLSDRYLFFHLQQQHFIELIKKEELEEALEFSQAYLAELGSQNPAILGELERTVAILAFEYPENSPFSDLVEESHLHLVARELNAVILNTDKITCTQPLLHLIKLKLWTSKKAGLAKECENLSEIFVQLECGKV